MIVVERAISLTQPWATLVAIGAKQYETRSWRTNYRGWLAIHAAKGFPQDCRMRCYAQPFARVLAEAGFNTDKDLPRGKVIALVNLTDCLSTDTFIPPLTNECVFGDYAAGRFAWKLENVQRIAAPEEAKGALGLWRLPFTITADEVSDLPAIFRRTMT